MQTGSSYFDNEGNEQLIASAIVHKTLIDKPQNTALEIYELSIAEGIKGAKELALIARNIQNAEKVMVLDALAGTGGSSGQFAQTMFALQRGEGSLPHFSELLANLKSGPSFKLEKLLDMLETDIEKIGFEGSSKNIRLFRGGEKDAHKIFEELSKEGKIHFENNEKIIFKFSDDVYITYRSSSKSGPPTIDIKLPSFTGNIKFKFIEE